MPQRYVITGGPGFGKTTIINRLEVLKYTCFHEFSRTLKLEEAKTLGAAISWSKLDEKTQDDFSLRVCKKRIEQYLTAPKNEISFFDRGIPDVIAYLHMAKQKISPFYIEAMEQHTYAPLVFLTPPWKDIYRNDGERYESFDEAFIAHRYIEKAYIDLGYTVFDIPLVEVELRVSFIINTINNYAK